MEDTKFTHKQKIKVIKGFYKGKRGKVNSYDEKTKEYTIEVKIDKDEYMELKVTEKEIMKVPDSFLPF